LLVDEIKRVLSDPMEAAAMAKRFRRFSKPDAARDMAQLILEARR
jgi:UDP-N-acetylglucosamine:LPS N-acetylglucosamine transferase